MHRLSFAEYNETAASFNKHKYNFSRKEFKGAKEKSTLADSQPSQIGCHTLQ